MYCYVRDCPNGLKSLKKKKNSDLIKYFPAPEDKNLLEKWRRVIPKGENVFSTNDKLCDSHFLPSEVLWFTETKLPNGNVRRLLRDEPILRPGTIPSIFPAEKVEKENNTLPGKEKQETPKPVPKNVSSVPVKEKLATPKSIVKNTNTAVKEKIETPKSNIRIRFKDPVVSSGKRHPQRVKRRSTILDDYWTDEELNQVHNPGATRSSSAKKRRTESGLQPVIRLVPLECLMDKTVSKSKVPSKPIVTNRPSTEEIDHELKKVIEIPLLTSLKPKKSTPLRAIKETVQFKPPKKNVSKTKMRIMANSEVLITHNEVSESSESSEGLNEVKTETPDIEEELARMEMEDENEDVKSSDIVMTNPALGEEDSVVVKSEEEDDGYSINEGTENPMMNIPEGSEIPTIKSESEEEEPATADLYDNVEIDDQQAPVPEMEAVADKEQGTSLSAGNIDSTLLSTNGQQPKEVPEGEVAGEVEQSKDADEATAIEAEPVEGNTAIEAGSGDNASSIKEAISEKNNEVEEAKIPEEESHEAGVFKDLEKEKTSEVGKEDEAKIPAETAGEVESGEGKDLPASDETDGRENDSLAALEVEPEKKDENSMETEPSQEVEPEKNEGESTRETEKEIPVPENVDETTKPVESEESTKPVESEEIMKPVEGEEITKPVDSEEVTKPVEGEEVTKPVEGDEEVTKLFENEASQATEEESKDTIEDGKECETSITKDERKENGAGIEEATAEMVNACEPSEAESETVDDAKETANEGESISDNVDGDLPEAVKEADGSSVNEVDKGETETVITINDDAEPSKSNDNVIDISDSEGVEAGKGMSEKDQESDSVINVDLTDADQSSTDTAVEQSSAVQEVESSRKDDESAMEIEREEPANVPSAEDIVDDVNMDANPVADIEVAEAKKDTENEQRDSNKVVQLDHDDDMDIEAEVARLVSEVEETTEGSPKKKVVDEEVGGGPKEASQPVPQPQEIVLQDTTNLGGITAAGVQNLFSQETIQEILKQIKLPLTTPVTFRIATTPAANTPSSSSSSGRGRGRRKGSRGMRGTNRQVVPRASSSRDDSHNSIDLFRHLTRTRTVFDFPTFVPDIDDDIQYWKLCQILKESFHELIETRNTKTSIGKLTLRVAVNKPKKPKVVQQNNCEPEADPQ